MKKIIIGNWKSNKNEEEALEWLKIVGPALNRKKNLEISIAPQLSLLSLLKQEIEKNRYHLSLSAQDVSPFGQGSYTGEVSAKSLVGLVKYVLVGHSERRKNFGETNFLVNLKVKQCLKNDLVPIVCISDVTTSEGLITQGLSFVKENFLREVRQAIREIKKENLENTVFMYEPPSAISKPVGPIGVGRAASTGQVLKMIAQIKKISPTSKIFYGGSVKSDNVANYLGRSEIDGVISGSASLNPQEFIKILENASQI